MKKIVLLSLMAVALTGCGAKSQYFISDTQAADRLAKLDVRVRWINSGTTQDFTANRVIEYADSFTLETIAYNYGGVEVAERIYIQRDAIYWILVNGVIK